MVVLYLNKKRVSLLQRGLTLVGWSYHSTSDDATQPHTAAGFANVTFIP